MTASAVANRGDEEAFNVSVGSKAAVEGSSVLGPRAVIRLLDAAREDAASNAGAGTEVGTAGLQIADILMRQHDSNGADLAIKTTKADPNDPTIGAITHFVRGAPGGRGGRHCCRILRAARIC